MFTGLIEGIGTLSAIRTSGNGKRISVTADFDLTGTRVGDSICVSGACLTVTRIDGRRFEADISPETVDRTTFGAAKTGERINLERALRLSDRIDGHLVTGHVDGTGHLASRKELKNATLIRINVDRELSRYIIQKGSIAVDGISLTVNGCDPEGFEVSIIPHTAKMTTIGFKKPGDRCNIETDIIGKYVERFTLQTDVSPRKEESGGSGIDMALLAKSGFLK